MSVNFQITDIILENACMEHSRNYGGKYDAHHLESNSARRLPFAIRTPAGIDPDDIFRLTEAGRCFIASFRRHTGQMEVGGMDFPHYKLQIREVNTIRNPDLPLCEVVIARVADDLLPLADHPTGLKMPDREGLPDYRHPIMVASHTADGGGWYTYLIWCQET